MKKNRFLFLIALAMFIALPFKVDAMSLKAYDYDGNEKTIEVEPSDKIEAVKEKIGMEADKKAEDTILVLNGKELENGRTVSYYSIESTDVLYMMGDIYFTFNKNGGVFENLPADQTEWIVPEYGYGEDTDEIIAPKREGYTFKGWYTEPDGGYIMEYVDELGTEEYTKFYAHWDKEGIVTIDFTTIENLENLSHIEKILFERVIENGFFVIEGQSIKQKNYGLVFSFDNNKNISLNNDLEGSIVLAYYITYTDKQYLSTKIDDVPDIVDFICHKEPRVKVTFDANGGTINGNSQYVEEDYLNHSYAPEATREGYYLKDWYTKPVGGMRIIDKAQLYDGIILYAHWEKEGVVTLDFANMDKNEFYLSYKEGIALDFMVKMGLLNLDSTGLVKNKDGKILLSADLNNNLKVDLADNLTAADNISYVLTSEEKEQLRQDGEDFIPDRIEVICSTKQVVKITFNANGGVFKNNITTIEIEDIINFDYDTFEKPTRKGYKFIGFYTKDGSKSYLDVNNSEAGFEEDTTFYAKWELDEEVPKTLDNITSSIILGTISLVGLVGATIYLRKRNKVRA